MTGILSRRNMLTGLAALPVAGAAVSLAKASSDGDAELLRLGAEFDRRHAEMVPLRKDSKRQVDNFNLAVRYVEVTEGREIPWEEYFRKRIECGIDDVIGRENDACAHLDGISQRIREMPATSLAGLAVKARALAYDTHYSVRFDEASDKGLGEEHLDWDVRCMLQFVREVEHMAEVAR